MTAALCLIYKTGILSVIALRGNAYLMEALAAEGKISPKQVLRLWEERLPLWKCCISPRKASWQLGVQAYHKVTSHNKPYIRNLLGEKNPGEWLPLLGWEAAGNWVEDRFHIGFLGEQRFPRFFFMVLVSGLGSSQGQSVFSLASVSFQVKVKALLPYRDTTAVYATVIGLNKNV